MVQTLLISPTFPGTCFYAWWFKALSYLTKTSPQPFSSYLILFVGYLTSCIDYRSYLA